MPPASAKVKKSAAPVPKESAAAPKSKVIKKKAKRGRRRDDGANFKIYIHKVLRQTYEDIGISSRSMSIMNSFINDMFERIVVEAARIANYSGQRTISARTVQCAVRLVLPGELAQHAVNEGTKAVRTYYENSTVKVKSI